MNIGKEQRGVQCIGLGLTLTPNHRLYEKQGSKCTFKCRECLPSDQDWKTVPQDRISSVPSGSYATRDHYDLHFTCIYIMPCIKHGISSSHLLKTTRIHRISVASVVLLNIILCTADVQKLAFTRN